MRRLTLRGRLLLVGVLGVGLALALGGVALYAALWYAGLHTVDRDATATADQVAQLVRTHHLPDPIPVTGSQIVQVVDRRDRVVSASVNGDRLTAMLLPAELGRATRSPLQVPASRVGLSGNLRVSAVAVRGTDRTVVVAQGLDDVHRSLRMLRAALLVTFPVLLLVLAAIAWRAIGATLRPVEQLRAGAERISGSGREERLPVPGSTDEVQALALTLNAMLDRLAESRDRQRSFVADVAHELRSPLASMRTQLEVARHVGEGGPLVDDLHADVLRMGALVEDLLTLARLDADEVSPAAATAVDVDDVVAEIDRRYSESRVRLRTGTTGLQVAGDRDELIRVLDNLVGNALRHAASTVEVTAVDRGDEVVVRVDDDGPGIPPADRERAFERFTRLDQARDRDAGGSGLGLAIVSALVARRGGRVRLAESPRGGLRAEVVLSRAGRAPHGR